MWKEMETGASGGAQQIATGTFTFASTSDQKAIQTGLNKIGTFLLVNTEKNTMMLWNSEISINSGATSELTPNRCLTGTNGGYATRAVGTAHAYVPIPVSKPTAGDITLFAPNYTSTPYYQGTFKWWAYEEVTS